MFYKTLAYLKFLLKSKNQHGIHSPFVFDLVTKCFYDKANYPDYQKLKTYRERLLNSNQTIEITDLGAGSKVFKSSTRPVKAMAQQAGISSARARLLFRITRYFKPHTILELGTHLGLSTSALHLGNPSTKLISLEGCPNTLNLTKNLFATDFPNTSQETVKFINTPFDAFLEEADLSFLVDKKQDWSLVYFDGNHSKEATLRYVVKLLPTLTANTLWIFDDIHWSRDMEGAWNYIKDMPEVTVSIDTFQWGLVFFRKEQVKQHFIIRI